MIIKYCGTAFTQIREHLGKTEGELAEDLELGKHGERLIERIEQNKEGIQPATLRKLLDLCLWWSYDDIRKRSEMDRLLRTLKSYKNNAARRKASDKRLYAVIVIGGYVALTIVNTVVFFT